MIKLTQELFAEWLEAQDKLLVIDEWLSDHCELPANLSDREPYLDAVEDRLCDAEHYHRIANRNKYAALTLHLKSAQDEYNEALRRKHAALEGIR